MVCTSNAPTMSTGELPREFGRYDLYDQIAAGGMATVHFGRLHGAVGFSRVVAVKRLHAHFSRDAHFVDMFLDEARLAARLKHPNVIATLDVVADESEVFLVMEYVLGVSLEAVMPRETNRAIPVPIITAVLCNVLEGLHSAHESLSDTGERLELVHRDVSPHNILVGADGVARVFDFGIAKATINTQETREGVIKGKVTYMAPEQLWGGADRRADVYAAGVILWELLVGRRRHAGERNDALFIKLARNELEPLVPPSTLRIEVPEAMDAIVARATAPDPADRFATTREMAMALEEAVRPALARDIAAWLHDVAGDRIERLAETMKRIEGDGQLAPASSRSSMSRPPSGTIRVAAGSITRTGGMASSVPSPSSVFASLQPSATTEAPLAPAPARRSWTMPAALLAFTAALLLVGLRTLAGHGPLELSRREGARAARDAEPPPLASSSAPLVIAAADAAAAATRADASVEPARPARVQAQWTPPLAVRVTARAPDVGAAAVPVAAPPSNAPPAPAAAHKSSCDSPFVVGADGIRQIKPECI